MVMEAPGRPLDGVSEVMPGATLTVNETPLLATPPAAVTATFPVVAPAGSVAVMLVLLHPLTLAVVPLKVTEPLPGVAPKFDPAMVTDEPTTPELGVRLLMLGAAVTVKLTPALLTPPAAVTTTLPVVAPVGTLAVMLDVPQLVTVAVVPLNFTEPLPCVDP